MSSGDEAEDSEPEDELADEVGLPAPRCCLPSVPRCHNCGCWGWCCYRHVALVILVHSSDSLIMTMHCGGKRRLHAWQLLCRMRTMMRMGTTEIAERRVMGTVMTACLGRRSCKGCSKLGLESKVVRGLLHATLQCQCRQLGGREADDRGSWMGKTSQVQEWNPPDIHVCSWQWFLKMPGHVRQCALLA